MEDAAGRTTRTVLLVEDEAQVRSFSKAALERASYRVLEARSAEEALTVADRYYDTIHALVTDIVLPGQSGLDFARTLSAKRPGLRVLYVSGYHDQPPEDPTAVLLTKPYMAGALIKRVDELLASPG